ncbi:MAG: BamA/TamA family outer membrane protein [Bacteroidia bacterium]|nr:BamA/TamA family outer membrane protein [Bacteroidia bacterium]
MDTFMGRRQGSQWYLGSLLILVGCSPLRFVPEGEKLVAREPILRGNVLEEVPPLYVRSNSRALGFRLGLQLYWAGALLTESPKPPWRTLRQLPKVRYYTYWLGWTLKEKLGEAPTLLSARAIERDIQLLEEAYIQEGYFRVAVQAQIRPLNEREVEVIYRIRPGPRWYIGELDIEGEDSVLVSLAERYIQKQTLPVGEPYRLSRLDALREELHTLFLEEGYQGLPLNALLWEIDTVSTAARHERPKNILRRWIGGKREGAPTCVVRLILPSGYTRYVQQGISLTIHTSDNSPTLDLQAESVPIRTEPQAMSILNPAVLLPRLYYPPKGYYNQKALQASQRALQGLEVVQWVGSSLIPTAKDSVRAQYDIVLRPPIDLSIGIEGFQSTQPLVGSLPLPGMSVNARFSHLSLFRRGWVLRTRAQVALSYFRRSADEPPLPLYNLAGDVSLTFPEGSWRLRDNKPKALPPTLSQYSHTFLFSYQDIRQIDFSRRYATLSWTRQTRFLFEDKRQEEQLWTPFSVTFVDSRFSPAFEAQIEALSPLVRSLILRDYLPRLTQITAWQVSTHRNYFGSTRGRGDYSMILVEIGGWAPFFLEHVISLTYPKTDSTYRDNLLFNRFRYGVFVRVLGEGRLRYMLLSPKQQLFLRGRVGWGQGLYYSLDLPFENRFFVGGPNSMRAWQFGALGPGRYTFPKNLFLIPGGTLLIEANAELRQTIYRGLQIAPFIDVGNVWFVASTLFEDPRGLLRNSPLPGIAGGVGLRWDFSVIVIRLDIAQQLFDPASGWVGSQFPVGATRAQYVFAVGYPF